MRAESLVLCRGERSIPANKGRQAPRRTESCTRATPLVLLSEVALVSAHARRCEDGSLDWGGARHSANCWLTTALHIAPTVRSKPVCATAFTGHRHTMPPHEYAQRSLAVEGRTSTFSACRATTSGQQCSTCTCVWTTASIHNTGQAYPACAAQCLFLELLVEAAANASCTPE